MTPIRYGTNVDQSVRDALTADPGFSHPDYADHTAWIIRDGYPCEARIVGVVRDITTYAPRAFVVLRSHLAITIPAQDVFWSRDDAADAQTEIDRTFDL